MVSAQANMAFESVEFAAECLAAAPDGWSDEEVNSYIEYKREVIADSSLSLSLSEKHDPLCSHTHNTCPSRSGLHVLWSHLDPSMA